uniref:Ubiquitin-like domain-containing protein n=1 Tax=Panagrolaimus sp. PS1159 TaxID=55785 RepID=A0AC35GE97_9BILA
MSDIKQEYIPPLPISDDEDGNEAFSSSNLGAAGPSHIGNEAAATNNTGQQQTAAAPSTDVRGNQTAPAPSGNRGNRDREYITLKLKNQDGDVIKFRVKYTTMDALMKKYAERTNLERGILRFLIDGERVDYDSTPKSLEMEEGNEIQVFQQVFGGQ